MIALVVLAALVGLGIVGVVVAIAFLSDRVEETAGVESPFTVNSCPFISDAEASTVFGAGATAQDLSGLFALGNVVLDTRVLPDAPSCWVVSSAGQGMARVAREQGGGDQLGEVLSAGEANCERARQVVRLVLDRVARPRPSPGQCRKWRSPVNTITRPSSSAAATTSSSRTDPPGWITVAAPASTAPSRPSGKGKKASLA